MQDAIEDKAPQSDDPWRSPLDELERTLNEVGRALIALRASLESDGEVSEESTRERISAISLPSVQPDTTVAEQPAATADDETPPAGFDAVWQRIQQTRGEDGENAPPADGIAEEQESSQEPADVDLNDEAQAVVKSRLSSFEGVWERLERERKERSDGDVEEIADVRGLGHLPQTYRITVEDRDGTPVDLVPIHRALLAFASADDISLVNFAGGVPIVSIRIKGEFDLERLAETIGAATTRQCEVIQQDRGKLLLRLSGEEGVEA